MSYDKDNVFARIIRGDIPTVKLYESDYAVAFNDLHPDAPVHVLIVPRGEYVNYHDFMSRASEAEIGGLFKAVKEVADKLGVAEHFRLITNNGKQAGQSVFHFHIHLLAGKKMGKLLSSE